jgi:hypothetical protein
MRFPDHKSEEVRQNNRMLLVGMDSLPRRARGAATPSEAMSYLCFAAVCIGDGRRRGTQCVRHPATVSDSQQRM